jgi:hypothetical protein
MRFIRFTIAALAATACMQAAPASAQTEVSGKYLITYRVYCIPTATFNVEPYPGLVGGYVNDVNLGVNNAALQFNMVLADFNAAKLKVSFTGFNEAGNVMLTQITGAYPSNSGSPFQESAATGKTSYSTTATSLTIGNQTFHALFGQVDKNSVASYITFQGLFDDQNGDSCSEQGEAARQ